MRFGAWLGVVACMLVSAPVAARADEGADPCQDGERNGGETDVDCGGECGPCWHRRACGVPSDCWSGLCADGRCRERVLGARERPPPGYELRMSRRDAPGTARLAGTAFLIASYAPAYVAAVSYPGRLGALYVPLLGPWLTLDEVELGSAKFALVADGSVQIAGAVLLIGGWALRGQQLLRVPAPEGDEEQATRGEQRPAHGRVHVALRPGLGVLSLVGHF